MSALGFGGVGVRGVALGAVPVRRADEVIVVRLVGQFGGSPRECLDVGCALYALRKPICSNTHVVVRRRNGSAHALRVRERSAWRLSSGTDNVQAVPLEAIVNSTGLMKTLLMAAVAPALD